MNGNWNESSTRSITLPNCAPAIFALNLNHVYSRRLTTMKNTREELQALEPSTARTLLSEEVHQLAQIYVLAE
jgi:hypothetical protein